MLPTRAIADDRLRRSDLRTLAALCAFRNAEDGACFPKHRTLAALANLPLDTVRGALRRLRAFGYIDWERSTNPRTGAWRANRYTISYLSLVRDGRSDVPTDRASTSTTGSTATTGSDRPGHQSTDSRATTPEQRSEQTSSTDQVEQNTQTRARVRSRTGKDLPDYEDQDLIERRRRQQHADVSAQIEEEARRVS